MTVKTRNLHEGEKSTLYLSIRFLSMFMLVPLKTRVVCKTWNFESIGFFSKFSFPLLLCLKGNGGLLGMDPLKGLLLNPSNFQLEVAYAQKIRINRGQL